MRPTFSAILLAIIGPQRAGSAGIVASIVVLSGAAGCAGVRPTLETRGREALTASPRLLTARELAPLGDTRLDDAMMRVRPELFYYRGREAAIYLDGRPASRSDLHALSANAVARVRMLSPGEAALEYGTFIGVEPILDVRSRRP